MKGKSLVKCVSSVEKKLDALAEALPKTNEGKKTKVKPPAMAKKDQKCLTS